MKCCKIGVCGLVFLAVILTAVQGVIQSQESKRLMVVFTTNTEGELRPCG